MGVRASSGSENVRRCDWGPSSRRTTQSTSAAPCQHGVTSFCDAPELLEAQMTFTDIGSRTLKVDHAGEFGAISIYTGQILMAKLFARDLVAELIEFRSHERGHRA